MCDQNQTPPNGNGSETGTGTGAAGSTGAPAEEKKPVAPWVMALQLLLKRQEACHAANSPMTRKETRTDAVAALRGVLAADRAFFAHIASLAEHHEALADMDAPEPGPMFDFERALVNLYPDAKKREDHAIGAAEAFAALRAVGQSSAVSTSVEFLIELCGNAGDPFVRALPSLLPLIPDENNRQKIEAHFAPHRERQSATLLPTEFDDAHIAPLLRELHGLRDGLAKGASNGSGDQFKMLAEHTLAIWMHPQVIKLEPAQTDRPATAQARNIAVKKQRRDVPAA